MLLLEGAKPRLLGLHRSVQSIRDRPIAWPRVDPVDEHRYHLRRAATPRHERNRAHQDEQGDDDHDHPPVGDSKRLIHWGSSLFESGGSVLPSRSMVLAGSLMPKRAAMRAFPTVPANLTISWI